MLVQDVMTRRTLSVTGDWRVKQAVILAAERKVSSLPVVDRRGRICGIVSDCDLIRDAFAHDSRAHERPVNDAIRTHAVLVREVMTSPAITVGERTDLADVVEMMTTRSLKTLPVVDDQGRVVGMVSRSDVLRIRARDDDVLQRELVDMLSSLEHDDWQVQVRDGVVEISGPGTSLDKSIATVAANTVAGVVEVRVA
jgi:CBS-domain-containing membrane protein